MDNLNTTVCYLVAQVLFYIRNRETAYWLENRPPGKFCRGFHRISFNPAVELLETNIFKFYYVCTGKVDDKNTQNVF